MYFKGSICVLLVTLKNVGTIGTEGSSDGGFKIHFKDSFKKGVKNVCKIYFKDTIWDF
jgi:hypothetical protein